MRRSQRTKVHYAVQSGYSLTVSITACGRTAHSFYGASKRFDRVTCKVCQEKMAAMVRAKVMEFDRAEWYWSTVLRNCLRHRMSIMDLVRREIHQGGDLS